MTLLDYIQPGFIFAGLVVGFLIGMTGVGGGSLMTPLLILLFRIHPQAAVGTDLLFAAVTKMVGTVIHGRRGTVDYKIVVRLAAGSIPATLLTILFLHGEVPSQEMARTLKIALGVALLLTAPSILFRPTLQAWSIRRRATVPPGLAAPLTVALGFLLGVLVTLSSVGAGAIGVTALIILYPELPIAGIVGSDIAHAVPLTLIAGAGHWAMGDVRLPLLTSLLCGSIPGIIGGSLCAGAVSDKVQRGILAAVLTLVGFRMI